MRFEDVTSDVLKIVDDMVNEKFPELRTANITVLFDTKKRKTGGRYIIGRIKKANDEMKALATDQDGVAPDYVLFLDKNVFLALDDDDKKRIVFHELCHTDYDSEAENPYKIKDHEIQTFYSEIDFNKDDPRWSERISAIADHVYDPDNNEEVGV